jgi:hypothetical protein
MHVDGDILNRLVSCGSHYLRQMLSVEYDSYSTNTGTTSTGTALDRLSELSMELFGESQDPVQAVTEWLRKILTIPV